MILVKSDLFHARAEAQARRFYGAEKRRFARLCAAILFVCVFAGIAHSQDSPGAQNKQTPESELVFEGLGSFGHFRIFADSWWSYLDLGGVEYDRHSWGSKLGAQMDYSAAFLPVAILRQPAKTDVWGDPLSKNHETVYGMGVSPIGLRMLWRGDKRWKPYFLAQGGLLGFTQKALSKDASYLNFTLHIGFGTQVQLTPRVDFRAGFSFFHFSDAFVVPSNPGLDSICYTAGLSYHLHARR